MSSEHSPLLPSPSAPSISDAFIRLHSIDLRTAYTEDICPQEWLRHDIQVWQRYSFSLLVLLALRARKRVERDKNFAAQTHLSQLRDIQDDIQVVEQRLSTLWKTFLAEYITNEELEHLLWTPFPVFDASEGERGSDQTLRVVDFLTSSSAPLFLLNDPILLRSVHRYWINGPQRSQERGLSSRLYSELDKSVPSILHTMFLLPRLAHLALLLLFVFCSPARSSPSAAQQASLLWTLEAIILVLSVTLLVPLTFRSFPYLLVSLSILLPFPSIIYVDSISYDVMLAALMILLVQLHLPGFPTPIYCAPVQFSLPLSVYLSRGLSHVLFPVLLFFLPILLVSAVLLSVSLKEYPFFFQLMHTPEPVFTPVKARAAFLVICGGAVLCFLWSLALVASSAALTHPTRSGWDRFSPSIGADARALLILGTVRYSRRYAFPPPFNLLHGVFMVLYRLCGRLRPLQTMERVTWRILIAPFSLSLRSGLWIASLVCTSMYQYVDNLYDSL